jgi:hypothetical protein
MFPIKRCGFGGGVIHSNCTIGIASYNLERENLIAP